MKRFLVVGILGLFMVSLMSGVLGADAEQVGTAVGEGTLGVVQLLKAFLAVLFNDAAFGEKEMLSRFFFSILLGMIVYSAMQSFFGKNKRLISWIATGAITALAIIAIPTNFLEAIRLQYGAMGAAILTIVPFAIIALFTIRVDNLLIATATWIAYSLYYFGLFGNKLYNGITVGENFWTIVFSADVFPYVLALLMGIIMAWFGVKYARKWWTGGIIDAQVEEAEASIRKRAAGLRAEARRLDATTGIEQE